MSDAAHIPIVDVSGEEPEDVVAKALVDAAATYGFVYVKNEGKDIPVAVIDRMFDLVRLSSLIHYLLSNWGISLTVRPRT